VPVSVPAVLVDAWRLWRRHRDLLIAVAAPWLFLPALALALLSAPPPSLPATRDGAAGQLWAEAVLAWARTDGGWFVLAQLAALAGAATLYALLLGGVTVRGAMARALRVLPSMVLAMLVTAPAVVLGLSLWLVPGLYVTARLVLVGPALTVERRGVLAAIGASVRRTRGHGLALTAAVSVPLLGGWLAAQPFVALGRVLREAGSANPVALAMAGAGSAAATFAGGLAQALVAVAAYRRLRTQ